MCALSFLGFKMSAGQAITFHLSVMMAEVHSSSLNIIVYSCVGGLASGTTIPISV